MTIIDATVTCLRKAFAFHGRATRAEFWWFSGAVVLALALALVLDTVLFPAAAARGVLPFASIVFVATAIPMLSAGWRRMQDAGKPGHRLLLPLLAYIGFVAALSMAAGGFYFIMRQRVYDDWLFEAVKIFAVIVFPLGAAFGIFAGVLILWWLAKPGTRGHNDHGPDPRENNG
jgi:uncharacterized membrane protein YhaH (DUF805 family)